MEHLQNLKINLTYLSINDTVYQVNREDKWYNRITIDKNGERRYGKEKDR